MRTTLSASGVSQNISNWKGPVRTVRSNSLLLAGLPKAKPYDKSIVQMLFDLCQAWGRDRFPGEPVPVTERSLGEELFPNVQSELPAPEAASFHCLVSRCWSPERGDSTAPREEVVVCSKVAPQPSLPQADFCLVFVTLWLRVIPRVHMGTASSERIGSLCPLFQKTD